MLVALKGLISRQPESPGLLGLAAHVLQSLEPVAAGWEFADELAADKTMEIAETIAITEAGGTDVIDSIASGFDSESGGVMLLCPAGTTAWIEQARSDGRSIAGVTPLGSRLPAMLWSRYLKNHDRVGDSREPTLGQHELIPVDQFDDLIGNTGLMPPADWRPDSPDVAEVARF